MSKRILAAALISASLGFSGAAFAEDTVESLRGPVIEVCKQMMGPPADGKSPDAVCTCMIDGIIKDFGDDALPMLKVLNAKLEPENVKEIATLLGISEADAKAFVDRANTKMNTVQQACPA